MSVIAVAAVSSRMRSPLLAAGGALGILIAVVGLCACDGEPVVASADRDSVFVRTDFESGWDGWEVGAANDVQGGEPLPRRVEITDELLPISDGRCAYLGAENATDAVQMWIERPFVLHPGRDYEVRLGWSVGPAGGWEDGGTLIDIRGHWDRRRPGGSTFNRMGPLAFDTAHLDPPRMKRFSVEDTVTTGGEGRLWIAMGFRGMFEIFQFICLDDIEVRLTSLN